MKNKVFISHASSDFRDNNGHIIAGNAISKIIKTLEANHIERWIDEKGLISAKGWCEQLKDAIDECNIVLFVASERANKSVNTANELSYAYEQKKHIIPFKLDTSPYHKAIALNLSSLHFLRYYEDPKKALADLVSTIKGINTPTVLGFNDIYMPHIPKEKEVQGKYLSQLVYGIFKANSISKSCGLIKEIMKLTSSNSSVLNSYLDKLLKIEKTLNYDVKRNQIINLITDLSEFNEENTERFEKILYYLLLMFLYYTINDQRSVTAIQSKVNLVFFERSLFERHSDTINNVFDKVKRVGFLVGGVAAMIGGQNGVGRACIHQVTNEEKLNLMSTSSEISDLEDLFESFKIAVQSVRIK